MADHRLRTAVLCLPLLLGMAAMPARAPAAATGGGSPGGLLAPLSDGVEPPLPPLDPAVPAPPGILGHRIGERFSRDEQIRGYLTTLAAASDRVSIADYGVSYENRPLTLVAITSPANQARLEEIRRARRQLADPAALSEAERRRLTAETPTVVWLGYGIHGNESSSSEAAMAVAYVLAAAGGEWPRRLDRVVVLIDPVSNPDGRERYVGAYQQRRGPEPDPDPRAIEHHEPWPRGRYNHYLIDLNRDWAWATQRETRFRLRAYRQWEPTVFVDLHEMTPDSTYFFPPSAEPINPEIGGGVIRWLEIFGRANADAFDDLGWLYYRAEGYDLFYPGYGDSYPSLRGAVGMTYEVAGGGRAGLALRRRDDSLWTLADRAARHLATSLATVATAADRRDELETALTAERLAAHRGEPTIYLWRDDQGEAATLAGLLSMHGVRLSRLAGERRLTVRPPAGGEAVERSFAAGTWAVSTAQPLGPLVRVLMQPETPLPPAFVERQRQRIDLNLDADFYDVTAWALPLAFNLEAWQAAGPMPGFEPVVPPSPEELVPLAEEPPRAALPIAGVGDLGYLLPWQGIAGYRAAGRLLAAGARPRLALAAFDPGGGELPAGSLFVPRSGASPAVDAAVDAVAADGVRVQRVGSSWTAAGVSLGSERLPAVVTPRIALAGGRGVSSTSYGFLWHLLESQVGLPLTRLELAELSARDLRDVDVLLLADGDYDEPEHQRLAKLLGRWVKSGGLLVAVAGATDWLRTAGIATLTAWDDDEEADEAAGEDPETPTRTPRARRQPYAVPELATPGAVLATRLTSGHPLAAGLPSPPPVLFRGDVVLRPTGDPRRDVLVAAAGDPVIAGHAWPEARERLAGCLLVATETSGDGRLVLFAQDPAFRLFWRGTAPLLLNAVLYGPTWSD